jgi:hypothetical protein
MRGVKRFLYYLGAGIAPYAISVFVDWGSAWLSPHGPQDQRFGLLLGWAFTSSSRWSPP